MLNKDRVKLWRETNKEASKAWRRDWLSKNKERVRKTQAEYRTSHKTELSIKGKPYRQSRLTEIHSCQKRHSRYVKSAALYFSWVKRHNYPALFRILCWNCNFKTANIPGNSDAAKRRLRRKMDVMAHYSHGTSFCAKCGEKDIHVLSIDHINGCGCQHRAVLNLKGGDQFYRWLQNAGYPSGYRVLCLNCNCPKFELDRKSPRPACTDDRR